MPSLRVRAQQPSPVPAQVELPPEFPPVPQEVLDRFPEAGKWQAALKEFWIRAKQAIQSAQTEAANFSNSRVVYSVDSFRIYAKGGIPEPMFALDSEGVKLGDVLIINTPGRKVYIGEGVYASAETPFYIDTLGFFSLGSNLTWDPETNTLTITGTINATSGTIGGFTIGADYVRDVANSMGLASTVTGGDDVRFWAGNTFANRATAPFRVTESGALVATNATISGTITATTGTIGGFSIGSDYIRDAANSMGLASTVTGGDDVRFWAGDTFDNRATAPFRVTESGALVASNANISGTLTSSSGTIGGFTLSGTSISAGSLDNYVELASDVSGKPQNSALILGVSGSYHFYTLMGRGELRMTFEGSVSDNYPGVQLGVFDDGTLGSLGYGYLELARNSDSVYRIRLDGSAATIDVLGGYQFAGTPGITDTITIGANTIDVQGGIITGWT